MKKHIEIFSFVSAILLAVALLCSCDDTNTPSSGNNKEKDKQEDPYDVAFKEMIGGKYAAHNWNQSEKYVIEVDPGSQHNIKVYTYGLDKYFLVADYKDVEGRVQVDFDAQPNVGEFLVEIGGRRFKVASGGFVSYENSLTTDGREVIANRPFSWIYAVENSFDHENARLYRKIDFDFNDVLFEISAVSRTTDVLVTITPLACGDWQPFYLHFCDGDSDILLWPDVSTELTDAEFHQWFGIMDDMTRVNTGTFYDDDGNEVIYNYRLGWASQTALTRNIHPCTLTLDKRWNMLNISQLDRSYTDEIIGYSGLYITVGSFKSADKLANDPTCSVIALESSDHAPHVLIFPNIGYSGQWQWPTETTAINLPYGDFLNYVLNVDDPAAMLWYTYQPDNSELVY